MASSVRNLNITSRGTSKKPHFLSASMSNVKKERQNMKNRFLLIISLITIALITSCSTSNEKANSLYAEAIHIMQSANINKTKSYSKTYELYKKAYKKIDLILSKYPKADIAVEIISGRLKIEKFTLSEFQGLECLLKTWAEAGQDPFLCVSVANDMSGL